MISAIRWLHHPLILLVLVGFSLPRYAQGQRMQAFAPDRILAGGEAVLYLDWPRFDRFEGGELTLPSGWTLDRVILVDVEGQITGAELRRARADRYEMTPETVVPEVRTVRLHVGGGEQPSYGEWEFAPYRRYSSGQGAYTLEVDRGASTRGGIAATDGTRSGNQFLAFDRDPAVMLDGRRLPPLTTQSAFTVESWVRTVVPGQVMLSVWTADEMDPYGLDLLLDQQGRAVMYQGMQGDHRTMRSRLPIADGDWHHVAVTHDPERGWARLLIDGVVEDSLHHQTPLQSSVATHLGIGGRPDTEQRFTGHLDELRIWGLARTPAMIRSTVFRSLPPLPDAGPLYSRFFSFDDEASTSFVVRDGGPAVRESDLAFRQDIEDLKVDMDALGLTLSWTAPARLGGDMAVERSEDGAVYEPVGLVQSGAGVAAGDGVRQYSYRDETPETVAFYRIRHTNPRGQQQVSKPLKVGRNDAVERPVLAVLEGSFPNPFNPTTSIRYELVEGQDVTVSVWDLSGQMIRLLHSGFQEPGSYTVPFSADELPSGTYFVRMESPEGIQSHPILLMK